MTGNNGHLQIGNPETFESLAASNEGIADFRAYIREQAVEVVESLASQPIATQPELTTPVNEATDSVAQPKTSILSRVKDFAGNLKENFSIPRPVRGLGAVALSSVALLGANAAIAQTPTPEDARTSNGVDHGEKLGGSVNDALVKLNVNNRRGLDKQLNATESDSDKYDDLYVSHDSNMQSRLDSFTDDNADKFDVALGAKLSTMNDDGFRESYANALQGKDPKAERSDSKEDQMKIIEAGINGDTKLQRVDMDGTYDNHGQYNEQDVFSDPESYKGVDAVMVIPSEKSGLEKILIKIGGGNDGQDVVCLNLEENLPPTDKPPVDQPPTEVTPPSEQPPVDQPPAEVVPPVTTDTPENPPVEIPNKVPKPHNHPGGPGAGGEREEGMDPENDSDHNGYGPGDRVPPADVDPSPPAPEVPATEQPTPTEVVPAPAPPTQPAGPGTPQQPNGPAVPVN